MAITRSLLTLMPGAVDSRFDSNDFLGRTFQFTPVSSALAQTNAKHSLSVTVLFLSAALSVRKANTTGLCSWLRTAATPIELASVNNSKGFLKSGNFKTGAFVMAALTASNSFCASIDQQSSSVFV
ncbi:hypothetical protein TNCV_2365721 [Trichonephila clavipes]|nr:hypothetical protein TNCV_2365721 [Trichonephila clavipes]